ncbi:hypothetical protein ACFX15_004972 [Malus domestica]
MSFNQTRCIFRESYAGVYVPTLASQIAKALGTVKLMKSGSFVQFIKFHIGAEALGRRLSLRIIIGI